MLSRIKHRRGKLAKCLTIMIFSSLFWLNSSVYVAAKELPVEEMHILSRLSFGAKSVDLEQVKETGIEAYIQSQLEPKSIKESVLLEKYLAKHDLTIQDPIKLHQSDVTLRDQLKNSELSIEQERQLDRQIKALNSNTLNDAIDVHLARAVYSNRQLQEVMVDFWFNHFNVFGQKSAVKFWLADYENQIRQHALGNFSNLLLVTAKHPAMLMYLDNKNNTAPASPGGKENKLGLNENYARELMELHTLGVDGGYSQEDVIALARIFTGWTMDRLGKKGDQSGFFFAENRHDSEAKLFLGHKIVANGVKEGEQALQILAEHPATAHFISYQLAQYFVADQPPESLVNHLAQTFQETQGNIRLVMDALIHSQEFNDRQYYGQKFKTPYQYVISLVRLGEIKAPSFKRLRGMLFQLSMPVYRCVTPDGYSNTQSAWLNPQAMLQRTGLATAIANGVLNKNSQVQFEQVKQNLGAISPQSQQVIQETPAKLRTALIMGSPEAMYR